MRNPQLTLIKMAITILAPASPARPAHDDENDYEDGGVDLEGDVDMELNTTRPSTSTHKAGLGMVTPGETVTEDPQWMR